MQKSLSFIIAVAIIYYIVQMKMQPPADSPIPKNQEISDTENNKTPTIPEQANTPLTGNFLEKTLSKVMINALKTEEGRVFFESLLQPVNKPNSINNYTIICS
jgi:hypothetical protein